MKSVSHPDDSIPLTSAHKKVPAAVRRAHGDVGQFSQAASYKRRGKEREREIETRSTGQATRNNLVAIDGTLLKIEPPSLREM